MDNLGAGLFVFVVGGLVSFLVLLIAREIVCWYWKVNLAVAHLARVEESLGRIDRNLVHLGRALVPAEAKPSVEPEQV